MSAFLTVAFVHLLGVMSPGPDFLMVTRSALRYSHRTGVCTAFGVGLGVLIHITYCLLGIGLLISQSIVLYSTLKYLGAAYLLYTGWKALTTKIPETSEIAVVHEAKDLTVFQAVRLGFLTNVLNPKASLFFLAIFTQVISPATPIPTQVFYSVFMSISTFVWFACVASILSLSIIKNSFLRIQSASERIMGGLLIMLGLKVAFAGRD